MPKSNKYEQSEALEVVLEYFKEEFDADCERYKLAENKSSYRLGFVAGIESSTLMSFYTTVKFITGGSAKSSSEVFQQIMNMLETQHYAAHVLRGGEPNCEAIDKIIETADLRISLFEKLEVLKDVLRANPPSNPSSIN